MEQRGCREDGNDGRNSMQQTSIEVIFHLMLIGISGKYSANRFRPIAVHRFKPIKLIRLEEWEREREEESTEAVSIVG